jgi:hypothetical protein
MIQVFCIIAALAANLLAGPAFGADIFRRHEKIIWIDQERQYGAAYGHGKKLTEFPIMTGDDETPTPPGTYVINKKKVYHYSRKYQTPMPYSLFFDYQGRAIHEGWVADTEEMSEWASHGCIHVEQPYMKWLFNWAEAGKTVVVVRGWRVWEDKQVNRHREERKEPREERERRRKEAERLEEREWDDEILYELFLR